MKYRIAKEDQDYLGAFNVAMEDYEAAVKKEPELAKFVKQFVEEISNAANCCTFDD